MVEVEVVYGLMSTTDLCEGGFRLCAPRRPRCRRRTSSVALSPSLALDLDSHWS